MSLTELGPEAVSRVGYLAVALLGNRIGQKWQMEGNVSDFRVHRLAGESPSPGWCVKSFTKPGCVVYSSALPNVGGSPRFNSS
jgi:hypothetical protein